MGASGGREGVRGREERPYLGRTHESLENTTQHNTTHKTGLVSTPVNESDLFKPNWPKHWPDASIGPKRQAWGTFSGGVLVRGSGGF